MGLKSNVSVVSRTTTGSFVAARTSMDLLADYGFYRKELFKNKYIYTPVTKSYGEQKEVIELK